MVNGGRCEIRTHGRLATSPVFLTSMAFATRPYRGLFESLDFVFTLAFQP